MSFRWQTDDDSDDPVDSRQPHDHERRRRRHLIALLALLILASSSVFLGWRNLRQRAEATEARHKEDVLSIHNLARLAVLEGDDELYMSLLPPQLAGWAETQQLLLEEDLLFTSAPRLYDLQPLAGAPSPPEVALDATLSQAIVTMQHAFAVTTTTQLAEAVTLRQMQTYSLGATGWQLAPPPPEFWLPEVVVPGSQLTLRYPQRDETFALELRRELARLLPQMCALPGLTCPSDLHLTVRLVTDPALLAEFAKPEALLQSATWRESGHIDLPTPSLIGQPVDEDGIAFVARLYAVRTIAPLISDLAGYRCCNRSLLARAIVERQLAHLGLQAWPLTSDDYEALMSQSITLGAALILQVRDIRFLGSDTWPQMLSLVEYLEESLAPGELLTYMEASLDYKLLSADAPGDFVVDWIEFIYARSRSAQRASQLDSLPQGVLQLTCFESSAVAIQRYELQGVGWQHSITYSVGGNWQIESVFPLPADYGEILKVTRREPQGSRLVRYIRVHGGGSEALFETASSADAPALFAPSDGVASQWRYTVLSSQYPALRASIEEEWWQIDLTSCEDGTCSGKPWTARPQWSHDGTQLLLEARPLDNGVSSRDSVIFRAGARGQNAIRVDEGFAPIWLSTTLYAYLRPSQTQSGDEIIIASTADDQPLFLSASDSLIQHIEEGLPGGDALNLVALHSVPGAADMLLVHATRPPIGVDIEPDSFVFLLRLDLELSQLSSGQLLYHSDGALALRPSPNGRWVAVRNANAWVLVDLQTGDRRPLGAVGAPAWSSDGNWLAQSADYHIMLHAPGLEYSRPIVHQLGDCPFSSLQWQSQ